MSFNWLAQKVVACSRVEFSALAHFAEIDDTVSNRQKNVYAHMKFVLAGEVPCKGALVCIGSCAGVICGVSELEEITATKDLIS